jgi:hypothetical protein
LSRRDLPEENLKQYSHSFKRKKKTGKRKKKAAFCDWRDRLSSVHQKILPPSVEIFCTHSLALDDRYIHASQLCFLFCACRVLPFMRFQDGFVASEEMKRSVWLRQVTERNGRRRREVVLKPLHYNKHDGLTPEPK